MGDVNIGRREELSLTRRKKCGFSVAEMVDDGIHLRLLLRDFGSAYRPKFGERGGVAALAVTPASGSKAFEDRRSGLLRNFLEQFIGVLVESVLESADGLVVLQLDAAFLVRVRPSPAA